MTPTGARNPGEAGEGYFFFGFPRFGGAILRTALLNRSHASGSSSTASSSFLRTGFFFVAGAFVMVTSLSQKPDYLKAVGLITAEWTAVEHGILHLFAMLAGCGMDVASAIFSAVESNRGRREMTWAVAQIALKNEPALLKEVETLLDRTRKAVSKRNLYAHALWGVKEDGSVVRLSHPIVPTEVSLDDLRRASDQMARLQHDFVLFTSRLFGIPSSPQTP